MTCCVLRQNGRLSKELDLVGHHVRTRLDELKRQEVSRLRMLLKAKLDSTNIQSELTQSDFSLQHVQDIMEVMCVCCVYLL